MPPFESVQSPLVTLLSIPSPAEGVWYLGPVPIRGYALCDHPRHRRRDLDRRAALGRPRRHAPGEVSDLAVWAVPFGLVGGRLYHVITD